MEALERESGPGWSACLYAGRAGEMFLEFGDGAIDVGPGLVVAVDGDAAAARRWLEGEGLIAEWSRRHAGKGIA